MGLIIEAKDERMVFTVHTFYQTVRLSLSDLIDNRWGLLSNDIVKFSRKIEKKGREMDLYFYVQNFKGSRTTLIELEDMIQRYYYKFLCYDRLFTVSLINQSRKKS